MSLTIHVLGPLVIKSDGCRLGKLPKKARALLAISRPKAGSGEPRAAGRLAVALPGVGTSPPQLPQLPVGAAQSARAGGRSIWSADFANCRIEDVDVDLDDFEQLSRSRRVPTCRRQPSCIGRISWLISISLRSRFRNGWRRSATAHWRSICDVLHRLAAAADAAGEYDAAIQSGRRLVALDPLSEIGPARPDPRLRARRTPREALRQYKSAPRPCSASWGLRPMPRPRRSPVR